MINNNRPKEYENFDDFLADEIAKDPTLPGRIKKAEQQIHEIHGAFKPNQPKDCPRCHGTGKNGEDSVLGYPGYTCYYCGGTGARPYMRNVEPSVPAEVSLCSVCQAMTHTIGGNCGKCGCLKPNVLADKVQVELDIFALDRLVNIAIAFAHGKATTAEISAKKTSVQALIARSNQQAVIAALEGAKKYDCTCRGDEVCWIDAAIEKYRG